MQEQGSLVHAYRTPTNTFQQFLAGFSSSSLLMYFAILVPWTINAIFQAGLHGWTLYVIASALPLAFLSLFLVMLKPATRDLVHLVSSITASILASSSAVIASFGIDPASMPDIVVLTLFLLAGFITVYLDILGKNPLMLQESTTARIPRLLVQGLGFALPALAMGISREIFHLDACLFYVASPVFILAALAKYFEKDRVTQDADGTVVSKQNSTIKASLIMLAFIFFFSTFTFSSIINIEATDRALPGYIAIAAGVGIAFIAGNRAWIARSAVMPGVLVMYVILVLDTPLIAHVWFVMLAGLLQGLVLGELGLNACLLPRSPKKASEGLYLFAILIVGVLAAVGANLFPALVHDLKAMNAASLSGMFIPLIFFIAIAVLAISIATSQGTRQMFRIAFQSMPKPGVARPVRNKNLIAALVLASIVVGPLIATETFLTSYSTVCIKLDRLMYDVNGNNMTEVDLAPMTAKILFYSPHPTNGTCHGELIRPGMSVRLGGYYYGYFEPKDPEANATFATSDVINWVGNNNDVFCFGFYGLANGSVTPSDILALKAMNPAARVYLMTFATTWFENQGIFNSTIEGFTLKLKNGSEALGVRRNSTHDTAHLMDLGNPGWAKYFAWLYENVCKEFHADGVAIDEVMWDDYWKIHDWNDGQTLLNYSSDLSIERNQVHQTCYDWLQRIRGNMSVEIITQAFWPQAQLYQNGVWGETSFTSTGGQYGSTMNDINRSVWYQSMDWKGVVDTANTIASKNESYIWAAWYQRNNAASLEYAIGTYMMAKPNNITSLVFHPQPVYNGGYPANLAGYAVDTVKEEVQRWPQYFNIQLGDALGTMQLKSSLGGQYYERQFQNGIVLVNPFHAHIDEF